MDEQMIADIAKALVSSDGVIVDCAGMAPYLRLAEAAHSVIAGKVAELEDWAFEQSRLHHRLAAENEPLRTEHIASSSAYRELGLKLREQAALAPYPERRSE